MAEKGLVSWFCAVNMGDHSKKSLVRKNMSSFTLMSTDLQCQRQPGGGGKTMRRAEQKSMGNIAWR